jgi:hypothetical protein
MPKIDEMYAFVACDEDENDEGIMGFRGIDGAWVPLVGADVARVESLKEIAKGIGEVTGKKIFIKRFKLVSTEEA